MATATNIRDLVLRRTAQNCVIDGCRCHSKTPRGNSLGGWSAEAITPLSGYHRNPFIRGFVRAPQTLAVSGAKQLLNGFPRTKASFPRVCGMAESMRGLV